MSFAICAFLGLCLLFFILFQLNHTVVLVDKDMWWCLSIVSGGFPSLCQIHLRCGFCLAPHWRKVSQATLEKSLIRKRLFMKNPANFMKNPANFIHLTLARGFSAKAVATNWFSSFAHRCRINQRNQHKPTIFTNQWHQMKQTSAN